MKRLVYLILIPAVIYSCQTAKVVYDDVYEAATGPSLIDESNGYVDLIKEVEKDHKVVVEDKKKVMFDGYYPSGGTSYSNARNTQNGDCNCGHTCGRNFNFYRYHYSAYVANPYFGQSIFYGPFFTDCSCCSNMGYYYDPFYTYHYLNNGSYYSLGGYYDYWGYWHGYYPWGYDPYGYYAYNYGWGYSYGWMNNNYWQNQNGWNNSPWNWGGGNGGGDVVSSGNHYYGHRGSVTSNSSNTTAYSHTVKGVAVQDSGHELAQNTLVAQDVNTFHNNGTTTAKPVLSSNVVSENDFSQTNVQDYTAVDNTNGAINPAIGNSNSSWTGTSSNDVAENNFVQTDFQGYTKPAVNNTGSVVKPTTDNSTTTGSAVVSTGSANTVSTGSNHVIAPNQFAGKGATGYASRGTYGSTSSGSGSYSYDPVQTTTYDNSSYSGSSYTTTSSGTSENSTSRSESGSGSTYRSSSNENYNSGSTNSGNSNSGSSGSTYSGHRGTTTSSNSSSGNSGGSTTSRR